MAIPKLPCRIIISPIGWLGCSICRRDGHRSVLRRRRWNTETTRRRRQQHSTGTRRSRFNFTRTFWAVFLLFTQKKNLSWNGSDKNHSLHYRKDYNRYSHINFNSFSFFEAEILFGLWRSSFRFLLLLQPFEVILKRDIQIERIWAISESQSYERCPAWKTTVTLPICVESHRCLISDSNRCRLVSSARSIESCPRRIRSHFRDTNRLDILQRGHRSVYLQVWWRIRCPWRPASYGPSIEAPEDSNRRLWNGNGLFLVLYDLLLGWWYFCLTHCPHFSLIRFATTSERYQCYKFEGN